MTTKHTPGPWKIIEREVLEDGSVYPIHITGGVTELEVCLLESPVVAHAYTFDESWKVMGRSVMQKANARLIAAAPELLEALQSIVNFWDEQVPTVHVNEMHIAARAAIAKATGEQ